MNNINKTLYIPLYGKSYVSKRGIFLDDKKAEEIWEAEAFALKGKSKSKWLAYYMGMRSAVFDDWLKAQMKKDSDAIILHIGCGMDSRVERVRTGKHLWYDVDFPEVMEARKRYFAQSETYRMHSCDIREDGWWKEIPSGAAAVIVMEGISMYLTPEELPRALAQLARHFPSVHLLMDCYTEFAAKMSKYKNPVNDVGVTQVYGMDDPAALAERAGITYLKEVEMTPQHLILQLPKRDQRIFRTLYASSMSKRLYRLYEFQSK